MRLTIVSGLSGSGKTVALRTLEDEGYYCVDNLPASLLPNLIAHLKSSSLDYYGKVAVGLDARGEPQGLQAFPEILQDLRKTGVEIEILFLQTEDATLMRRFSETRRKHPLSSLDRPLDNAIALERSLLGELIDLADMIIDTT
ncbi:MAG: RNase adapter RapZ, partial [Pseudomonadota bacterium]